MVRIRPVRFFLLSHFCSFSLTKLTNLISKSLKIHFKGSVQTYCLENCIRACGLVVWFSLRVREVGGSIPPCSLLLFARAKFIFPQDSTTQIFCVVSHCAMFCTQRKTKNTIAVTHDGTRTHNLALRRGTPYPFGHAGGTVVTALSDCRADAQWPAPWPGG